MKIRFIITASLVVTGFFLFSFTNSTARKRNSEIVGFWMDDDPGNSHAHIKVFEESGNFCELHIQKGQSRISHKGRFEVTDESHIRERVTEQSIHGIYALKNREFITTYELSSDGKKLVQRGTVVSKNGTDTLKWTSVYTRMEVPQ